MLRLFFLELQRKAFHISGSLIPIVYYFLSKETAIIVLSTINAILLLIEWQRLKGKIRFPKIILRPHENNKVAAYIYFQIAALISILIFDKTIAIASILMLAIGDAAAGLAGALILGNNIRGFNSEKITIKPPVIMVVMFAICILLGLFLSGLQMANDMIQVPFAVYAAGAFGATLGDAISLRIKGKTIDDNLMIPLLSGLFMTTANLFWI
ncbi:MAG: hypothetical protein O8C60_01550 [Candidatus Methanoperedens sp.]|nr:hypothetical protein [Candidatus Methanoperedens sp.]